MFIGGIKTDVWQNPIYIWIHVTILFMSEQSLYERLGKRDGVRAVVDDFYDRLLADDELGPFFETADMEKLRRTQTDFLCETAGGPETYDAEPVWEAHLHVPFTPAHIERAVALLYESLDTFDVPDEDAAVVVQAVAAYEKDLLARPGDTEK
jgi:hemoglobin